VILASLCLLSAPLPALIPAPERYVPLAGTFELDSKTVIVATGDAKPVGDRLREFLRPATGFELPVTGIPKNRAIELRIENQDVSLGAEGYRLVSTPEGITITAPKPAGLFYGVQSLRQLLPTQIFDKKKDTGLHWTAPACQIIDKPSFGWRGMHLDVSRHFYDVKFIKEYIDWLAVHKMNTFHWHLVDDGGWRIEIKKYPKLTQIGAWREKQKAEWSYSGLIFPGKDSGKDLEGGFYTQDQVREIVKYAADRYITVVPEIEMPGHSTETLASYPELMCSPAKDVLDAYIKRTGNDYPSMVCAGKESTVEFFQNVLTEILQLFPSKFIHIGGDECPKDLWAVCPDCQARMQKEGLKNEEELQSYFIHRMDSWLANKGRRLLGWDEILEGGLAPGATVMSWRGIAGGIAAAKAGHDVVMSPTSHCYFDYPYTSISTEVVYGYDPIPGELTEEQGKHVLGAQANIWTEWISSPEEVETMMFPRAAALAEAVWTPFQRKDWADFSERLKTHYDRLDRLGIAYYVTAPTPISDVILLGDAAGVEFNKPDVPNSLVRYTIDGSEPTANSPAYSGAIRLSKPGVVRAATFRANGTKSATISVPVMLLNANDEPKVNGVIRRVIQGKFDKCPEPAAFASASARNVTEVSVTDLAGKDEFAVMYEGFVRIPEDGVYTFSLGSDDGSKMWLGDSIAIDNDGPHGYVEKRLRLQLKKGDYPFRVVMFEIDGAENLRLFAEGPGLTKSLIPASMLWSKE